MVNFILCEAKDKAAEIQQRGDEEFQVEVHRLLVDLQDKVRKSFELKAKKIDTQYAIQKSMAINKMRLEKIKARQEILESISKDVKKQLTVDLSSDAKKKPFVTNLIVQGLLMFLESDVTVRCRSADVKLVESCLDGASKEYSRVIKAQSGVDKSVKLAVD